MGEQEHLDALGHPPGVVVRHRYLEGEALLPLAPQGDHHQLEELAVVALGKVPSSKWPCPQASTSAASSSIYLGRLEVLKVQRLE